MAGDTSGQQVLVYNTRTNRSSYAGFSTDITGVVSSSRRVILYEHESHHTSHIQFLMSDHNKLSNHRLDS